MKRIYLLMALLVSCGWLAEPCQAQKLYEQIQNMFAPLDKRDIQSGILIQQTPVFISPSRYDGRNTADSMRLSLDRFGMLYGQFRNATVSSSPILPAPEVFLGKSSGLLLKSDTINLALMALQYDYIRAGAIENNLVAWSDRQLIDVPGRSNSPYKQDTCFAFTALNQKVQGRTFHFVFPEELLFSNLGWAIQQVEIDFSDGSGFQRINLNEIKTVVYERTGTKTVRMRFLKNGLRINVATFIDVEELHGVGGERDMPYVEEVPWVVSLSGMDLSVFSSCTGGGKILRPLIVLEGFYGENFKFKNMFDLLNDGETTNDGNLKDYLNTNEYDLIYIDYHSSLVSVESNAIHLIEAIEWINARKHADGSSEPNVLIGNSMGGLVGKLALLKMHNEQGKDSEVERFFTYDSPLKGANFPVGIQAFIRDLINQAGDLGASTASLQQALLLLDSPSAKDLLIHRVALNEGLNFPIPTLSVNSNDFNIFQSKVNNLEAIRPLGDITRHIAIANGAGAGIHQQSIQPTEPGSALMNILHFGVDLDHQIGDDDYEWLYNIEITADAYSAIGSHMLRYERHIVVVSDLVNEFEEMESEIFLHVSTDVNLDNAPGGNSEIGLKEIRTALDTLNKLIIAIDGVSDTSSNVILKSFCFIPTISSLGMPVGTSPGTPSPSGGSGVARWSASTDASVTSPFTDLPEFNQQHVSMNTRIADLLASELSPTAALNALNSTLSFGQTYNFGRTKPVNNTPVTATPRALKQDLIINNAAQLWINRNGQLGYMFTSHQNGTQQSVTVNVPGETCNDSLKADVIINNGGKIIIGDYANGINNIGKLRFGSNSSLTVNGQEAIFVDKYSTLGIDGSAVMTINSNTKVKLADFSTLSIKGGGLVTVEQNGMLELNAGAQCIIGGQGANKSKLHVKAGSTLRAITGSTIIVESGGILEIDANANLDLWWPESNIHIKAGGELRINGNFNRDGLGYFQFDQNNILSFSPSVTALNLQGEGLNNRLLQINQNATLNLGKVDLNLSYAQVQYLGGAGIIMQQSKADLFAVTFVGPGYFSIDDPEAVNARFCDFNENSDAMQITNFFAASNSNKLDFWQCDFNSCRNALLFSNATAANITGCNFDGSQIQDANGALAIHARNMVNINFYNSYITNYPLFPTVRPVELWDVHLFKMLGGSISNVYTGIWVPCNQLDPLDHNTSNVFMHSGAIIQNCTEGILIEKGGMLNSMENHGMVSMRCSKLINNQTGIKGVDVLLDISGCAMNTVCMPNSFIQGDAINYFFDIAYVDRPIPAAAVGSADNNFWSVAPFTNLGGGNSGLENYKLYQQPTFNNCLAIGFKNKFAINTLPELATPPINCTNTPPNPEPNPDVSIAMFTGTIYECIIPMDGQYRMDQEYTLAHWEFITNSNSDGHARFQSIAATPNSVRNAASANCQHSIDVARVMAQGTAPTFASGNNDNQYSQEEDSDQTLQVFPNPASESVQLFFSHPIFTVHVYDLLGKQYLSTTMADGATISVANWPSGLYLVTAIAEESNERSTIKLVVN
jgi:Secretion system C-terminal sorting domain